ncbi:serine--tRNA ligase [Curtobacterium sp. MCJR17_055]|uniref:serine--tRNA ligase n=1 Tax=unclassified Curtobacterium TaxID=257496 RepID=UPI000D93EC36|nr:MULTISPECIES: serine--tRNA ligase [unclassified Curtobacterium]PYY33523.1 serine--tRNA ligase [Curtobacterium sp. MCBD17_029]PYY38856.1 serine--tRNA ligase [Curtobacterium sp. MCPF17_046]PYY53359.1 serine--tRNA ligase [Curtobacterium sp. MCJR17_055]PYY57285.1 serine--tRNA ligase [Curtobacterium sp. MCPF17_015]PZE83324.1 serine--tRNA ligase [Curtobacterium sp. MCBD17_032]
MIDPQLLRDEPDLIKASQAARGASVDVVDQAVAADAARRSAITAFEALRAEQNAFGKTVAKAPKDEKAALVQQAQALAAKVKEAQATVTAAEDTFNSVVRAIPNVVLPDVPAGGEDDFVTLRTVGTKPSFAFEPKDHADLGESLGIIDIARGVKVSGSRFYFLKGMGARLEIALMSLGLDRAVQHGFEPLITPTLVRPETMAGTGFLGEHAAEVYRLEADDLYLTGTSEVALAGYHADEILQFPSEDDPALRYAGWSTCYRREAGSAGKDNRGILRVHQFNKLEMFAYVHPDQADAEHQRLMSYQESMLQDLGLHYRVIETAAGDLGTSAARKYDLEAWVPTQGTFRELTSTSNCTTFQARRLDIRYRTESGKTAPVATLNGTLATTRWLVAILETHQQEDGSVVIPEVLRPYLGGVEVIEPR